jgi:hypothetical protein
LILAGVAFLDGIVYTGRSRKILDNYFSGCFEPQTAAVWDFDSNPLYEKELYELGFSSENSIYKKSNKSEISSDIWNISLFKGEPKSTSNTLTLRGGAGSRSSIGGSSKKTNLVPAGSSKQTQSLRPTSNAGPSTPTRKIKNTTSRKNPVLAISQSPLPRLSSASSAPESNLVPESQEQSDLRQTQSDLQQIQSDLQQTQSDSETSDFSVIPESQEQSNFQETQSNSEESNSSSFFPVLQKESVIQKCKATIQNCCCPAPDLNTSENIPEQLVSGQELDPPMLQMMQRRPDSATKKYIHPDAAHGTINQRIHELDKNKIVYGVLCEGRVAEKRLGKLLVSTQLSAETVIPSRDVFLRCPLGKNRDQESANFKKILAEVNRIKSEQNSSFESFRYNESLLEKKGLQATFSIPNKRTQADPTDCEKIDVIIWADIHTLTEEVLGVNVLVLGDVPYNERSTVLGKVKKAKSEILQSLPKLASYTNNAKKFNWKLVEKHEFDHYVFKNDATNLGLHYKYGATHSAPTKFNRDRPQNFNKERAKNFQTSLAEDSVLEAEILVDSFNPNNLFDKAIQNSSIPNGPNDNIRAQFVQVQTCRKSLL